MILMSEMVIKTRKIDPVSLYQPIFEDCAYIYVLSLVFCVIVAKAHLKISQTATPTNR